ncbi:hypothetical protein BX600DRAFT_443965 [Xylariales sp. PMI_506]|nr:hypothetical protein BX600DRAFT_443965 [Xylariales sp. PMI_506]
MASFIRAAMRLVVPTKSAEGQVRPTDEEQGPNLRDSRIGDWSTVMGGFDPNQIQRTTRIPKDDSLAQFRLLLGISCHPSLGYQRNHERDNRPADNMGIYSRVVKAEQESDDKFRVYSAVINACFFLQIVVAAALTAMGAAGANHSAITAFGAINTIIAGFLTFLKGSGLPGCYQYYATEWKKLREHIEQREREFSREDCMHDVQVEVRDIEQRFNSTARDIEANTPDRFSAVTRNNGNPANTGGAEHTNFDGIDSKLVKLDGYVRSLAAHLNKKGQDVAAHVEDHEKQLYESGLGAAREHTQRAAAAAQEHEKHIDGEIRGYGQSVANEVQDTAAQLSRDAKQRILSAFGAIESHGEELAHAARNQGAELARAATDQARRNLDEAHGTAAREIRRAADVLEGEGTDHK